MTELEEITETAKGISRKIIASGEEHCPTLLMITPTKWFMTQPVGINKDDFKRVVSAILRLSNAYAYIYIHEAWAATLDKDSPLVKELFSGRKKISELPPDDRVEVLTMVVAENGKSYHLWEAKIKYTRDGSRYLGEWTEKKGRPVGRMILTEW